MSRIRIAHISDLHLGKSPAESGVYGNPEGLASIFGRAYKMWQGVHDVCMRSHSDPHWDGLQASLQGFDAYVISGDLARTGDRSDMGQAFKMLSGNDPYSLSMKRTRDVFPRDRVIVVPGNHDRYQGEKCEPLSSEFERASHFSPKWNIYNRAVERENPRADLNAAKISARNGVRVGFVSIDCSYYGHHIDGYRRGWWRMLGGGFADAAVLDRAVDLTLSFRRQSIPTIWVIHFPPRNIGRSFLGLENWREVIEKASKAKVELILSGHTHKHSIDDEESSRPNAKSLRKITVVTAGSATEYGSKGLRSYWDLTLRVEGMRIALESQKLMVAQRQERKTKELFRRITFVPQDYKITPKSARFGW